MSRSPLKWVVLKLWSQSRLFFVKTVGFFSSLFAFNDSNHLPPLASEEKFITDGTIVEAREATEEDLLVVHTKRYLNRLKVAFSPANLTVFVNMKTLCT